MKKYFPLLVLVVTICVVCILDLAQAQEEQGLYFQEIDRFDAPEAHQGIAVDEKYFYAVDNQAIGKYDKKTGELVDTWVGEKDGPIIHLDSGMVLNGKLYAANSNWPDSPMTSSVEIWNTKTMEHIGSHSFGIRWGSCTWVDRHDGAWWAVFANYSRVFDRNQSPYGNSYWTTLIKFDDHWQWQEGWIFPEEVIKRALPMSISGGSWGEDGLLYASGHDHPEIYALKLPEAGSTLELQDTLPINSNGQGIAWDRSNPGLIYAISRPDKQVIVSQLTNREIN